MTLLQMNAPGLLQQYGPLGILAGVSITAVVAMWKRANTKDETLLSIVNDFATLSTRSTQAIEESTATQAATTRTLEALATATTHQNEMFSQRAEEGRQFQRDFMDRIEASHAPRKSPKRRAAKA